MTCSSSTRTVHMAIPSTPGLLTVPSATSSAVSTSRSKVSACPSAYDSVDYDAIPQEAWTALDLYKQKDTTKGASLRSLSRGRLRTSVNLLKLTVSSDREVQSDRQRAHHEAKFLQDNSKSQVAVPRLLLAQRARSQTVRSARE